MIQTVTGIVDATGIKNTLSHEHIVFGSPGYIGDTDNCYVRETAFQNAQRMIRMAQDYDVNLILDATTIEWGRDPYLLKKLSETMKINIACATGFFKDEGDTLAILKSLSYSCDLEACLKEIFVREITEGIKESKVKAGIIKAASSLNRIKPLEETILKAAAKAQRETNVPLLTHCDRGTMGLEQTELLLSAGADPRKIIVGHMTSNRDLEEIKRIMDRGVYAAFDQFGILSIPGIPDDGEKTENLLRLLRDGYEDSIVLSHDCVFDRMGYVSKSKPRYPDMIYRTVLPALRENGVPERAIAKITRENLLKVFR